MKIEILAKAGIKNAFRELNFDAARTYKHSDEPRYEVWEIEKSDMHVLENAAEWSNNWGTWCYSKGGSGMGTPFEFLTVNGTGILCWTSPNRKESFKSLTEYLSDVGVKNYEKFCDASADLARANGMKMSKLFQVYGL